MNSFFSFQLLSSLLSCRHHRIVAFLFVLTIMLSPSVPARGQQQVFCQEEQPWLKSASQVLTLLLDKHVHYQKIYDARDFGLPAPDSLHLKTQDGYNIFAYEISPDKPRAVIICLSGIENPSVTAYYGHAALFYQSGIATIMPDLRGHGKSDGDRICIGYEETLDVKAVTDYINRQSRYQGIPVILMGVSMGGGVAIRSISDNEDIDALICLSAYSSFEDFLLYHHKQVLPMVPDNHPDESINTLIAHKYGAKALSSSPIKALPFLNNRPLLLMHSRQDSQVPFLCFEKILAEAQHYTADIDTFTVAGDQHFICDDFTSPASDKEYTRRLMRFIGKFTTRHPSVSTSEYVELMEVIGRLADNSIFADTLAPRYQRDCDSCFSAFQNHPAVIWMKRQLPVYGISYDAIPWMGLHIQWTSDGFVVPKGANKTYDRWPNKAIKAFLPLLSDFYQKSRFHDFYARHTDTYQAAVNAARINIGDYIDLDWLDNFFGTCHSADFSIIPGLNNGAGSFGIERSLPGKKPEKIAVMLYAEAPDGSPIYNRDSEEDKILVHEFCHSYISVPKRYKKIGKSLLKQHRKQLNSIGYGTWQNVIEESLVRVSVIRYMVDHGYSEEAIRKEIEIEHKYYGFTWLPQSPEWYKGDVLKLFDEMMAAKSKHHQ